MRQWVQHGMIHTVIETVGRCSIVEMKRKNGSNVGAIGVFFTKTNRFIKNYSTFEKPDYYTTALRTAKQYAKQFNENYKPKS